MKKSSNSYLKYVYIIYLNYAINIINVFSLSIDLNYINLNGINNNIKIVKSQNNDDDVSYDSIEYISNTYYFNKSSKMFNSSNPNEIMNSNQYQFCTETMGKCIILSIMMGLLIICTIIGNSFVIAAVILERNLHNVANYLIVSLASADLTVAIMVIFILL
jgi:hypothetical protein